jgi:hypothetical protein
VKTVTHIGSHPVQDHELGPQINWELLAQRLEDAGIPKLQFCSDVHIWLPDLNRYLRNRGKGASANTRHRVLFWIQVNGLDPDGEVVTEGKQPASTQKAG